MNSEGSITQVSQVVARFARATPPYAGEAHIYRELGIESVAALHLLLALEAEFSVSLDDRRFMGAVTVGELARLVEEGR